MGVFRELPRNIRRSQERTKRRNQASVRGCVRIPLLALLASTTSAYSSLGVSRDSNPHHSYLRRRSNHSATSAVEVGVQGTVKDQSTHNTGTLTQLQLSLGQGSGVPPVLFCLTQQQVLADLKPAYRTESGSSSATLPSCKTPPPALDGSSVNGGEVHE